MHWLVLDKFSFDLLKGTKRDKVPSWYKYNAWSIVSFSEHSWAALLLTHKSRKQRAHQYGSENTIKLAKNELKRMAPQAKNTP